MAALRNPRHEQFAQGLAAGKSQAQAYAEAGYQEHRGAASRLAQDVRICARVAELLDRREQIDRKGLERAIERTAVDKERVIAELALIGFSNMADYMKVGPSGDPVLDFSALTRDQAAALVEVTVENFTDGRGDDARDVRRVKFRLADKRAALVDLGRYLGMFVNRHELNTQIVVEDFEAHKQAAIDAIDKAFAEVAAESPDAALDRPVGRA